MIGVDRDAEPVAGVLDPTTNVLDPAGEYVYFGDPQVRTTQVGATYRYLTNGGGGVGNNTQSVVMLIYQYAFALSGASNYNSASALGVVLMLVLGAFSGAYLWLGRDRG